MADRPLRTVVVGGGITGMAAAFRLQNRLTILGKPFEIFLIEASNRLGGLVRSSKHDGFLLEEGPDSFLSEKSRGIGLCHELAITRHLLPTQAEHRRSFIYKKNRLNPIPRGFHILVPTDPIAMLGSRLISWKAKLRMFKEFAVLPSGLPDESLGSFVRRRFGQEILDNLVTPIVSGIYSADPETLSMRATFPQYLNWEHDGSLLKQAFSATSSTRLQASGARYSLLMSFKDGMQTLIDEMGAKMTQVGAQLNTSVKGIVGKESGWDVTLSNGQTIDTDAVCLALSANGCADLLGDVDPGLASMLREIPHSDSLSIYYALPESEIGVPLNGFGMLIPASERKAFTACTFVHRKFSGRAPKGMALLRAFSGGKAAAPLWSQSDAEIDKRIFTELKSILKIKGAPLFAKVFRYPKALPHYSLGHLDRLEVMRQRLAAMPTLAIAGNWRGGIGIPDCIDSGERAAEQLVIDLCRT